MFRVEERNEALQQNRHIYTNEFCDKMEGLFAELSKALLWIIPSANKSSRISRNPTISTVNSTKVRNGKGSTENDWKRLTKAADEFKKRKVIY